MSFFILGERIEILIIKQQNFKEILPIFPCLLHKVCQFILLNHQFHFIHTNILFEKQINFDFNDRNLNHKFCISISGLAKHYIRNQFYKVYESEISYTCTHITYLHITVHYKIYEQTMKLIDSTKQSPSE